VSDVVAAIIGLSLWGSANVAEIVRGSIQSIPGGQFLGASALGFNWYQAMVYVIMAQALRRMIAPMMGLLTNLIQSTALASVIGVLDILTASQRSIQRLTVETGHSHSAAILGAVMLVFFILCTPLTYMSRRFEARLRAATGHGNS
ncbi:MAG: ABC transporter permease subunit, partial [Vulcanimicrobiaceae bacterium]